MCRRQQLHQLSLTGPSKTQLERGITLLRGRIGLTQVSPVIPPLPAFPETTQACRSEVTYFNVSPLCRMGITTFRFRFRIQTPWPAVIVFAVQQALGTNIATLFQAGTAEEIILPVSKSFQSVKFDFTLDSPPFIPDEFYFSNSYNDPIYPITNSINPDGTIINVADVSLTSSAVPEPSAWAMMLLGFASFGYIAFRRTQKGANSSVSQLTRHFNFR